VFHFFLSVVFSESKKATDLNQPYAILDDTRHHQLAILPDRHSATTVSTFITDQTSSPPTSRIVSPSRLSAIHEDPKLVDSEALRTILSEELLSSIQQGGLVEATLYDVG
jgi:hypothetical protein